jgi:hypothetical protein
LTIDRLHSLNDVLSRCMHAISRHHGFELWKHTNHCFLISFSSNLISIQQASRDISSSAGEATFAAVHASPDRSRCREGEHEVWLEQRRCCLHCCS